MPGRGETLVGTPDPEDGRTPEERYADHMTDVARDFAVEKRVNDEFTAAANNPDISAVELAKMLTPRGEGPAENGE